MSSWSAEEDAALLAAYKEVGVYWAGVAERVGNGRTQKACRMRYNRLVPPVEEEAPAVEPAKKVAPKKKKKEKKERVMDPVAVLSGRRGVREMRSIEKQLGIEAGTVDSLLDFESGTFTDARGTRKMPMAGSSATDEIKKLFQSMGLGSTAGLDELSSDSEAEAPSLFDEAVATLVMQFAKTRADAEEYAEQTMRKLIADCFGADVDYDSPDVAAFLNEYIEHQLSHFKQKGERKRKPMKDARLSTKGNPTKSTSYDIYLGGPGGPLTRLTVITDLVTGEETIDEEYSDMDRIYGHVSSYASKDSLSPRQWVKNCQAKELMMLMSGPVARDDIFDIPHAPCERSVKENVERLVAMTGHRLEEINYVMTPLQVYRDGRWVALRHIHEEPSKRADPDDKIPYKNGLSILKLRGEIIINKWSVWLGKTWCDTASVIDTSNNGQWKVTDHVLFCYGHELNNRKPYSEQQRRDMDNYFEEFVEAWERETARAKHHHGAPYEWTTIRPGKMNECICKARSEKSGYPFLIGLSKPVIYSALVKTHTMPEKAAEYLRNGGMCELKPGPRV